MGSGSLPFGEPALPPKRASSRSPLAARNPSESSGSAGSAASNTYDNTSVSPKDNVIADQVNAMRRCSRAAAARNSAKNTKSLEPIWATPSEPSGWNASVNAFSTCSCCSTITLVGPAATL